MNDVKKENKKLSATVLFAVCFFAYMTSYIGRNTFSALLTSMTGDGVLTRGLAGTVATSYMFAYGIGQLVFGRLCRVISPVLLMPIGLIGSGLANVGMAFASTFPICVVFWGLCGVFNAMLWPSLTRAFAEWLPDERKKSAGVNISLTIPLGSAISFILCSCILGTLGWKAAYVACGVAVILSGVMTIVGFSSIKGYISDRKQVFEAHFDDKKGKTRSKFPSKVLFGSLAIMVIPAAMINGALKESVTNWVPTIVSDTFETSPTFSSLISVLLPIVSVSGAYIAKFVDKFMHNELKTSAVMFGAVTACHIALVFAGKLNLWLTMALIAVSVAATWGINTMLVSLLPLKFAKTGSSGAVSGVLNSGTCLFSGVMSSVYSVVSLNCGWTSVFALCAIFGVLAISSCLASCSAVSKIHY